MTVRQLHEKLEALLALWDADAEIRLCCEDVGIPALAARIGPDRAFQIQAVTGYEQAKKDRPAIVEISIRLWGKPE